MKIYTKTGDQGTTSLIDGKRISKSDLRISAYGSVDELNSYLGWLVAALSEFDFDVELLKEIQNELFVIGAHLAIEKNDPIYKIPDISNTIANKIENEIDILQNSLPKLTYFIIPGGSKTSAMCHIARCVCRRSEREIVALMEKVIVNKEVVIILNRLSDYLFVLARKVSSVMGEEEKYWKP